MNRAPWAVHARAGPFPALHPTHSAPPLISLPLFFFYLSHLSFSFALLLLLPHPSPTPPSPTIIGLGHSNEPDLPTSSLSWLQRAFNVASHTPTHSPIPSLEASTFPQRSHHQGDYKKDARRFTVANVLRSVSRYP